MINKALRQINFPALLEPELSVQAPCIPRCIPRSTGSIQQNGSQHWLSIVLTLYCSAKLLLCLFGSLFSNSFGPRSHAQVQSAG